MAAAPAPAEAPAKPAPRAATAAKPRPTKPREPTPEQAPAPRADLLERAEQALSSGRMEDARVLGLTAAEHQPARPEVWEFLGRCYMRMGRAADARTFYARYLALAPDGPKASFIRAILAPSKGSSPQ
jgi:hypothetical protein